MRYVIVSILLVLITTSCGGGFPFAPPTATPTPTNTPTATPDLRATATAQAQATSTAQAAASSTALAQSTATAQAQATARAKATSDAAAQATQTTQALVGAVNTLAATGKRAYFVDKGNMGSPPPYLSTQMTNLSVRNFALEVKFLNPGADFSYRIGFRDGGPYSQYRLALDSSATWRLLMTTESAGPNLVGSKTVASGRANSIDLSPTGSNAVRFVVNDKVAFLFLNGQYIAAMDVSERNTAGDLWIASTVPIQFENFIVYALP